jgi:hypothetical protein
MPNWNPVGKACIQQKEQCFEALHFPGAYKKIRGFIPQYQRLHDIPLIPEQIFEYHLKIISYHNDFCQ